MISRSRSVGRPRNTIIPVAGALISPAIECVIVTVSSLASATVGAYVTTNVISPAGGIVDSPGSVNVNAAFGVRVKLPTSSGAAPVFFTWTVIAGAGPWMSTLPKLTVAPGSIVSIAVVAF